MAPKKTKKTTPVTVNTDESNRPTLQCKPMRKKAVVSEIDLSTPMVVDLDDAMNDNQQENERYFKANDRSDKNNGISDVWAHLTKEDDEKARCSICGVMLRRKNSGTTGLRKHLHQIHNLVAFSASSVKKRQKTKQFSIDERKQIDLLIIKCIIDDGRAFGDMRRPGVLKVFNRLAPGK